jgi:hypothetical protein
METRAQGGGETHECGRCGESFATQEELDRHMQEQHGDPVDAAVPRGTGGARTDGGGGMLQSE